jgi:serine/threonine protein kinase
MRTPRRTAPHLRSPPSHVSCVVVLRCALCGVRCVLLHVASVVWRAVYSKVDIWSLGCVIIEMASAKPPWSEENFENPFRALYHIGNSNAIPKIPDKLSDNAKDFVRLCLQR